LPCASPEACAVPLGPAILNPPAVVYRGPLGPFAGKATSGQVKQIGSKDVERGGD
jgi:hypothetical protein